LIAGTEENNIYCFEINEIFDIDIKNHELKYLETETELVENVSIPKMVESFSKMEIGSGEMSSIDYFSPKKDTEESKNNEH